MGYSCGAGASKVEQAWWDGCRAETGSQNTFIGCGNVRYFFERSNIEHSDGAITGTIWRYLPCGEMVRKAGGFRIEGNGTITRAPAKLKKFAEKVAKEIREDKQARTPYYSQVWGTAR